MHMTRRALRLATALMIFAAAACGGAPDAGDLRDSFAKQVESNTFVRDFKQSGDDITFTGPGAEGGTARWRIHIDSAVVEETGDQAEPCSAPTVQPAQSHREFRSSRDETRFSGEPA